MFLDYEKRLLWLSIIDMEQKEIKGRKTAGQYNFIFKDGTSVNLENKTIDNGKGTTKCKNYKDLLSQTVEIFGFLPVDKTLENIAVYESLEENYEILEFNVGCLNGNRSSTIFYPSPTSDGLGTLLTMKSIRSGWTYSFSIEEVKNCKIGGANPKEASISYDTAKIPETRLKSHKIFSDYDLANRRIDNCPKVVLYKTKYSSTEYVITKKIAEFTSISSIFDRKVLKEYAL